LLSNGDPKNTKLADDIAIKEALRAPLSIQSLAMVLGLKMRGALDSVGLGDFNKPLKGMDTQQTRAVGKQLQNKIIQEEDHTLQYNSDKIPFIFLPGKM
jgi:hypothetical protein